MWLNGGNPDVALRPKPSALEPFTLLERRFLRWNGTGRNGATGGPTEAPRASKRTQRAGGPNRRCPGPPPGGGAQACNLPKWPKVGCLGPLLDPKRAQKWPKMHFY